MKIKFGEVDALPSLKRSGKIGSQDGGEGLPDLEVAIPSSPFLDELASIGEQHISNISVARSNQLMDLEDEIAQNLSEKSRLDSVIKDLRDDISEMETEIKNIKAEYSGDTTESHSSRVTDRRYLSGNWYLAIISVTIIGEIVITYPAFEELFADALVIAVLSTLAAAAMTISYSHILGISLKRNDDRKRRQPRWVMPSLLAFGIPIVGLVLALSNLRSIKNSSSNILDFSLNETSNSDSQTDFDDNSDPLFNDPLTEVSQDDPFLEFDQQIGSSISYLDAFALFAFLQFALIVVATFASYYHFSTYHEDLKRHMAALHSLRKEFEKSQAQNAKLVRQIERMETKKSVIEETHKALVGNIMKKVAARAQAYWGSNARQRPDSPMVRSREFPSPKLDVPEWY